MLEGIFLSAGLAYVGGYIVLQIVHAYDRREAKRIRKQRESRQLARDGRVQSNEDILQEARANVLHGWD